MWILSPFFSSSFFLFFFSRVLAVNFVLQADIIIQNILHWFTGYMRVFPPYSGSLATCGFFSAVLWFTDYMRGFPPIFWFTDYMRGFFPVLWFTDYMLGFSPYSGSLTTCGVFPRTLVHWPHAGGFPPYSGSLTTCGVFPHTLIHCLHVGVFPSTLVH